MAEENNMKAGKKVFTINTYFARSETDTLIEVIKQNGWREVCRSANEGHLIWFGLPLRMSDVEILQKRASWLLFNRYPSMEVMARKKVLSKALSRLSRLFPNDYNFAPPEFLLPEQSI